MAEIAERAGCSRTSFSFECTGTQDLLVRLAEEAAPDVRRRLADGALDTVVDVLVDCAALIDPLVAEAQRSEVVAEAADRLLGPLVACALESLPSPEDEEGRACIELLLRIPHATGSIATLRLLWGRALGLEPVLALGAVSKPAARGQCGARGEVRPDEPRFMRRPADSVGDSPW